MINNSLFLILHHIYLVLVNSFVIFVNIKAEGKQVYTLNQHEQSEIREAITKDYLMISGGIEDQ